MGGYGSGRQSGRPTADASLRIDLAWMLRTGRLRENQHLVGALHRQCGGRESGSISYRAAMHEPSCERLDEQCALEMMTVMNQIERNHIARCAT